MFSRGFFANPPLGGQKGQKKNQFLPSGRQVTKPVKPAKGIKPTGAVGRRHWLARPSLSRRTNMM